MSISRKNEKVNYLTTIRENGVTTEEIVETVREIFPKYNKSLLTKCERPAEYGIELRPKAVELLRERFGEIKAKNDGHKLTTRLACRVPDAIYSTFKEIAEATGNTVNSLAYELVRDYLRGVNDTKIAYNAQAAFCREHGVPLFAPKTCFACSSDVCGGHGWSALFCASNHITSCPHCHKSFID